MKSNLPYPFNVAFEDGHSIDYRSKGEDHEYVKKLGYSPKMGGDCAYYAPGLNGFSLSSYGDWGTFYPNRADDKEKEMFLDMFDKGIIKPFGISAYIRHYLPYTKDWLVCRYSYNEDDGWKTYNERLGSWLYCEDPLKDKEEE